MSRMIKWTIVAIVVFIVAFTVLDFLNTAGDTGDPDAQLAMMLPEEREFCETVLWQIDSGSSERDVLALLGPPSRSLKMKKNWWVKLGGKKDRIGVYFDTSGLATRVFLDGGFGRFYYTRKVIDHEMNRPEDFQQPAKDEVVGALPKE